MITLTVGIVFERSLNDLEIVSNKTFHSNLYVEAKIRYLINISCGPIERENK
jgi:hypothetical protein